MEESRPVLGAAATNAMNYVKSDASDVFKLYVELQFLLNIIDRDVLTLIAAMIREPWTRLTIEKLIAMTALEGERSVGVVLGQMIAASKRQQVGDEFVDTELLIEASKEWHAARLTRDADTVLTGVVRDLRNNTTAHLYGRDERLNMHVPWVLTRIGLVEDSETVARSTIVKWASDVTLSVHALGGRLGPMRASGSGKPAPNRKARRGANRA